MTEEMVADKNMTFSDSDAKMYVRLDDLYSERNPLEEIENHYRLTLRISHHPDPEHDGEHHKFFTSYEPGLRAFCHATATPWDATIQSFVDQHRN
jgi:hypothetical protein